MLNAREPKIVNGPQILDKYVGESEANIRKLFADAEEEEKRVILFLIQLGIFLRHSHSICFFFSLDKIVDYILLYLTKSMPYANREAVQ